MGSPLNAGLDGRAGTPAWLGRSRNILIVRDYGPVCMYSQITLAFQGIFFAAALYGCRTIVKNPGPAPARRACNPEGGTGFQC